MEEEEEVERVRELSRARRSRGGKRETKQDQKITPDVKTGKDKNIQGKKKTKPKTKPKQNQTERNKSGKGKQCGKGDPV